MPRDRTIIRSHADFMALWKAYFEHETPFPRPKVKFQTPDFRSEKPTVMLVPSLTVVKYDAQGRT